MLVSLAAISGALLLPSPAHATASSAEECVSLQSATVSTGLAIDVQNSCSKRLACVLSWTLTCENASGKTTSKARQEVRFAIAASDTHHTTGSAAACKDSWKIDDVAWDCAPSAPSPK